MDFFAREEHAQRSSRRLTWLFILAVLLTVVAINAVAAWAIDFYALTEFRRGHAAGIGESLRWQIHAVATLGTLLVIAIGSWSKISELSGGGTTVAAMLGGREVPPATADPRERQLRNVVEEMAIASGVPMPQVYVLDGEHGINAFAAGHGHADAVVAVTRGALDRLHRDELQGVIGHEFSHLLNGDMRLNLRLMGLVHGLLAIGLIGGMLVRLAASGGDRRERRGGNGAMPLFAIGAALYVIGSIGSFLGGLIKAGISRQREHLADASSVQFTRNPPGLANALKKLGDRSAGSLLTTRRAGEASHFFFGDAVGGPWLGLLATHPPLASRIRALDPAWDGTYPSLGPLPADPPPATPAPAPAPAAGHALEFAPEAVAGRIGSVSPAQVAFGAGLLASIPPVLAEAARERFSVRAVALGLMLDDRAEVAALQLETLGDPALAAEVRRLHQPIAALGEAARLPLLDLCAPALRQLSPSQRAGLIDVVRRLARTDGELTLAEFCMGELLERLLGQPLPTGGSIMAIRPLLPHVAMLLSALARSGQPESGADHRIRTAFAIACAKIVEPGQTLDLLPAVACKPERLGEALAALGQASPGIKRRIVNACAWCVAADRIVTIREAELLRAVASCLGCPLPPFAPGVAP